VSVLVVEPDGVCVCDGVGVPVLVRDGVGVSVLEDDGVPVCV
jgi:hypothetical protein